MELRQTSQLKVHDFSDYRAFLLAHADEMRMQRESWSYHSWSRRLGLKTTSSITKILQGQREAGKGIAEKLIHYFGFDENEANYFRDLIRLRKVKDDPRLSVLLLEKMAQEHPQGVIQIIDPDDFALVAEAHHFAIREAVRLADFREDPDWIRKRLRLKVTSREVKQAVERLLKLGLLVRDARGGLGYGPETVRGGQTVFAAEAVRRYHRQMLEAASDALELQSTEREFGAVSLIIQKEKIVQAKELIRQFQKDFSPLVEASEVGEEVYQLQIQFFPLTQEVKKEKQS